MSISLRERLHTQLIHRRQKTEIESRRLYRTLHTLREKGLAWVFTVAVLLITAITVTGITYFFIDQSGMLAIPSVQRLDDPRWGLTYQEAGAPVTTIMATGQKVYIGTQGNGLHAYDTATGLWQSFRKTEASGVLAHDRIRWIKQDDSTPSQKWTLTQGGGLSGTAASTDRWRTLFGAMPFEGLESDTMTTAARNGRFIAVGTRNNGLGLYDLQYRSWVDQERSTAGPERVTAVRAGQRTGEFWAGASNGIWHLTDGRPVRRVISDSVITDVIDLEADADGVWFLGNTGETVGRIDQTGRQRVLARSTTMPFNPAEITTVGQQDNRLWVGTEGQGVHTYDVITRRWQPISLADTDSTILHQATSLVYNSEAKEVLISGDNGLHIIKTTESDRPSDTLHFAEYEAVSTFQTQGLDTYFLDRNGKIGVRRGYKPEEKTAWWENLLARSGADSSDLATLVDVSSVRIDPDDISAACQSDEYLYFGTIHGDIVWYHKPTHAWSTLQIPLPFAVDDLIYNPYTESVVAISGRALYRSPPSLDIFILYYSIGAEKVKVVPINNGYLLYTDDRNIMIFDETTNRREAILLSNSAPEPDFTPVAVEKIGAQIYFVTDTGGVLVYDTLRHQWHRPPDIPHKDVVDLRGTGYRAVYQTSRQALYVPGSFPILGGGRSGLADEDIRHAAADQKYVWLSGNRHISRYDQQNHTWENARRISLAGKGVPTHMLPLEGRLFYRTGSAEAPGNLWMDDRRVDTGVIDAVTTRNVLWYTKPDGLYRRYVRSGRSSRVVTYEGFRRLPGETLTTAAQSADKLWLATDRRLLNYDMHARVWRRYNTPGAPIDKLFVDNQTVSAYAGAALYRLSASSSTWRRISGAGRRIEDLTASPSGMVLLYDNQTVEQISRSESVSPLSPIKMTPNQLSVPLNLPEIRAAAQIGEYLCIVSDGYLYRYHARRHSWERPLPIGDRSVDRAVFQDQRLITEMADGRIITVNILAPQATFEENPALDEDGLAALSNSADLIWIDTPLWQWGRREGRPVIIMKARQGEDVQLESLTGPSLTQFPFDRLRSVAHDGVDVWFSTDMGLVKFPQTGQGHIDTWVWYRMEPMNRIDYVRLGDQNYALIGQAAEDGEALWRYDRSGDLWRRSSISELSLDPRNDSIDVDTSFWQWRRSDGVLRPSFSDADIEDVPVFSNATDRWFFRFDAIRGIEGMGNDLIGVADGLVSRYASGDSALSLSTLQLSRGPVIPAQSSVRLDRGEDGRYLVISTADDRSQTYRIRSDNTGITMDSVSPATNPLSTQILGETTLWRWIRTSNGTIRKYIRSGDDWMEIQMSNGRFAFDDFRTFAISGDNIWLATSQGIARYPFSRSALPLTDLQYETSISGHDRPDIALINTGNNRLYCDIPGIGMFSRRLTDRNWEPASADEKPWIRKPIDTPFWTWQHDVSSRTAAGIYRDVKQEEHDLTWQEGLFLFDRTSDLAWHGDAVWLVTEAGIAAYPEYRGFLNIDSLKVYSDHIGSDGLLTIPSDRPADPGLYTRHEGEIDRFDEIEDEWELYNPDEEDNGAYTSRRYLNDQYGYRILADYDGFWRCRRREDRDGSRMPNVFLETRVNGEWEQVVMTGGRFDFDVVTDFHIDGMDLWLSTQAGLCRYDLQSEWLDLRRMQPFWGEQYGDATDIRLIIRDGADRIYFRRGKNNQAVYSLDMEAKRVGRVPAVDSPFTTSILVETPYWRWVGQEDYRGSVAVGSSVRLDLKAASGLWANVPFTAGNRTFPFDRSADLILFKNAAWLATPAGILEYPVDRPFRLEHATLHWLDGRLERAGRLVVNQDGRLYASVGEGRTEQHFFLDDRARWQPVAAGRKLEQFRFREDRWFWYESESGVEIRFEDDPGRLRSYYTRQFADHYVVAVASDTDYLWCLTRAGLFTYNGWDDPDSMRLNHWFTADDFIGTPSEYLPLLPVPDGLDRKVYSIMRHQDEFWILSKEALLRYRFTNQPHTLAYISSVDFTDLSSPVIDGHLFMGVNGKMRMTLLSFEDGRARQTNYLIDPQSMQIEPVPLHRMAEDFAGRISLPEPGSIVTTSEDDEFVWLAVPEAVYRVDKTVLLK